jgi:hypothetical protein
MGKHIHTDHDKKKKGREGRNPVDSFKQISIKSFEQILKKF